MNNMEKKAFTGKNALSNINTRIPVRERMGNGRWCDSFIINVMRITTFRDDGAAPKISYAFVTDNGAYALFDEDISFNNFSLAKFFNMAKINIEEWYSDILEKQERGREVYRKDDDMRLFCYHNTDFGRHYACR